jgi:hypothetical protein
MPRVLLRAFAVALLAEPTFEAAGVRAQNAPPIRLELRIFLGADEVSSETRVTVHRAGERTEPVSQITATTGEIALTVPAGIYDVQVIREREGRVANIRWAERLVVMPYPDEAGRHLEVINFTSGFGALQIPTAQAAAVPEIELYPAGQHGRPAATRIDGPAYALFVVPAGRYDVQVRSGSKAVWHTDIEVPLDRTRLWVLP